MNDQEKIALLVRALNEINKTVFAHPRFVGCPAYFKIRETAVESIRAVGGKVE